MKNKKIAALLGILLAGSMAFSLSACGNSNDSAASDKSSASASASKADDSSKDDSSDSAGFEEIQVDEKHSDQECGPLTVNAVYFQPIDMEPSGMASRPPMRASTSKPTSMPTRRAPNSATARAISCRT